MKLKYYLQIAELPGWLPIFSEILGKMDKSGMLDACDEVNLCCNGVRSTFQLHLQPLIDSHEKFKLIHVNGDASGHERPTINYLKDQADATDDEIYYVGYGHLKGVTRPDDQKMIDWRNHSVYWSIERWKDSINKLNEGYEIASVNWMEYPHKHFSGNFWWASSNYIRRLKRLADYDKIQMGTPSDYLNGVILDPGNWRFENEAWSGSGDPNLYELHKSHPPADVSFHYNNEYPASNYREV